MKYVDEFRRPEAVEPWIDRIEKLASGRPATLMDVCGTHTVAIFRSGLRSVLPKGLRLLSGPGCPVCVTPNRYMDRAAAFCRRPGTLVATFGDMFRVPGSTTSLEAEKAAGADVRVVYSAMDAVELAAKMPSKTIVFLGVGFETTAPSVAASVLAAGERGLKNYHVYCGHKTMPAVLENLVKDKSSDVQGLILPGHVSAIIGTAPYAPLASAGVPAVITGFEPLDVAQGIAMLLEQLAAGEARVEVQYKRTVRPEGNAKAARTLRRVFEPCDSDWRGIGTVPGSGLAVAPEFEAFDAEKRLPVDVEPEKDRPGCLCGQILRGAKEPSDCPLFGETCTPESPVGACMVSSEGACAAHHKYGREKKR